MRRRTRPPLTSKSLDLLQELGYELHDICESYNSFSHRRKDLFGFIDLLGVSPDQGLLAVQVCQVDDRGPHLKKLAALSEDINIWLAAGCRLELWAWRKLLVRRGGVARVWKCDRTEITPATLTATARGGPVVTEGAKTE